MKRVYLAVRDAVADLTPGDLVLVACSGGPDSLALAAAAARLPARGGPRAGAVVVDHGWSAEASRASAAAARECRALGLDPVELATVDPGGPGGPEGAARAARYAALGDAAERFGAAAVLLGHTLDDQAETVLLGLGRGSGARSLAGMPARRGPYRRPLLGLTRADTEAACAEAGLAPWRDPANDDPAYARARVRRLATELERALGPGVVAALARSAELLREDADALDAAAAALLVAASAAAEPDALDVATLAAAPAAVRRRALLAAARAAGSPAGDLSRAHALALDALLADGAGGSGPAHLPGRVSARRDCGRLRLAAAPSGDDPRTPARPSALTAPATGSDVEASDMGADLERVLLTEEQIQGRLGEIAAEIQADYAGQDLLLVGVLKGALMVMADLSRALHRDVETDWMAVSSYGSGTKSSGVVRILKDLDRDITGRHVLIVEDIVDSGLTLSWLVSNLGSRGPASVEVCTLLRKPDAMKVELKLRYVGFDIPNEFVVGYGLDYAEKYRNLRVVGTLAPHVYSS